MFAGVPSRTPSAASRSAGPADSAGRRTSSASSTIATPSFTASRTAWRAGEGVWWTTSRRGTQASSPAIARHRLLAPARPRGCVVEPTGPVESTHRAEFRRVPAGTRPAEAAGGSGRHRCSGFGGESADEVAVAHEDSDDVAQVHPFPAGGHLVGQGWFAGGEERGTDRPVRSGGRRAGAAAVRDAAAAAGRAGRRRSCRRLDGAAPPGGADGSSLWASRSGVSAGTP